MSNKYVALRWRTVEKMRLVVESWFLKDEELGAFLRRNGLHLHDLHCWRIEMAMGIDGNRPVYLEERKYYKAKITELEKRLKEAEAIIELQKKVKNLISEDEAKKPQSKPDKK